MAELRINPPGNYTNYFIVALDGQPYCVPEPGADLALALHGRVPSRYEPGGMDGSFGHGGDEEGIVLLERFCLWSEQASAGGVLQFEGMIRRPEGVLHAQGALAFGSLETPSGISAVLSYEGLSSENWRKLAASPAPPLGTLRMW